MDYPIVVQKNRDRSPAVERRMQGSVGRLVLCFLAAYGPITERFLKRIPEKYASEAAAVESKIQSQHKTGRCRKKSHNTAVQPVLRKRQFLVYRLSHLESRYVDHRPLPLSQ